MSKPTDIEERRRFLKTMALGAIAPLAGSLLLSRPSFAADLPHLKESDSTAKQLGYKQDASQVDASKYSKYETGQECANCRYFQGSQGDEWGGCTIFAGKAVHAQGWCSAYSAK